MVTVRIVPLLVMLTDRCSSSSKPPKSFCWWTSSQVAGIESESAVLASRSKSRGQKNQRLATHTKRKRTGADSQPPSTGHAIHDSRAGARGYAVLAVRSRLDRVTLRDHDAAMRVLGATLLLILASMVVTAWRPEAASACSGRNLDLRDAIGLSHGPIYAGRITRAESAATFWVDVTIDIDLVVRGPAATRVRRAQAGDVCDGILAGEWGYMVRDVRDPEYPESKHNDLFFHVSPSYGRNVLRAAGLPDTSTASGVPNENVPSVPWGWLALSSGIGFVVAYRGLRRDRREGSIR